MIVKKIKGTEVRRYRNDAGEVLGIAGTVAELERLKILDLGLEERLTSKVGLLSGGQRQALTLLMATLKKPKVLLLDEHTAALDPKTLELTMLEELPGEKPL